MTIGNAQIPFMQSVKILGLTFDCHLTMTENVFTIARTCYFVLRRQASTRGFLTNTATATLASVFSPRFHYCSSLLFGSTHDVISHLHWIRNYAARGILRIPISANHTCKITSLTFCQRKKHLQNSLFVLPLPQQYHTIICH